MILHSHLQGNGTTRLFSLIAQRARLKLYGRKNPTPRIGSSCLGWHITDFRWITWRKSSNRRFLTLIQGLDQIKERLKLETMLWLPLRKIGWKRNKGRSEDTWRRMEFNTNLSISSYGLTLLHMGIQTLNILKMILFNISTMVSISRRTERTKTGVAFLIFFHTSFLRE